MLYYITKDTQQILNDFVITIRLKINLKHNLKKT